MQTKAILGVVILAGSVLWLDTEASAVAKPVISGLTASPAEISTPYGQSTISA